jgi:hypothetical protein
MRKRGKICLHLLILPAAAAIIAAFGCAVMFLWNALLPRIAGLPAINFWEAAGLLILAWILFGGIGKLGGSGWHHGHKNPFRDKWLDMSDEERKEFVTKFHGLHHRHHGHRGHHGACDGDAGDDNAPGPDVKGPEKE